ncbi:hypothetical protein [Pseudoroseicyclus sp. CXY001]|uniref:hypothetical protein n=1 Tax=Pseudoroseicyclus sp. CXY001 TaxID=3242492 RepID=UPI0035714E41
MSDPAKNVDIEDVLASIRRLVSEGERSQSHGTARRGAGRLILTPAQRVAPDEAEADPVAEAPEEAPAPVAAEAPEEAPAESPASDVAEAPFWSDADMEEASRLGDAEDHWKVPAAPKADDIPEEAAEEPERELWSVDDWLGPAEAETLGTDEPRIGPELEDEEDEAPALDEEVASLEAAIARRRALAAGEDLPPRAAETPAEEREAEDAPADDLAGDLSGILADGGAEAPARRPLRLVDMARDPAVEEEAALPPIVAPADGPEPAAAAWAKALAEAHEVGERRRADAAADTSVEERLDAALRVDGIDEAALRELVTKIIREELQGALGERITRNVRKLVRREIYRALAEDEG